MFIFIFYPTNLFITELFSSLSTVQNHKFLKRIPLKVPLIKNDPLIKPLHRIWIEILPWPSEMCDVYCRIAEHCWRCNPCLFRALDHAQLRLKYGHLLKHEVLKKFRVLPLGYTTYYVVQVPRSKRYLNVLGEPQKLGDYRFEQSRPDTNSRPSHLYLFWLASISTSE